MAKSKQFFQLTLRPGTDATYGSIVEDAGVEHNFFEFYANYCKLQFINAIQLYHIYFQTNA